jgi:predicted transcriptional regulator
MTKIGEELQTLNEKMEEVNQKMQKIGFLLVQLINRLPEEDKTSQSAETDISALELMVTQALTKSLENKLPGILQREISTQIERNEKITAIYDAIKETPRMDLSEIKNHNSEVTQNIEQHMLNIHKELEKLTSGKIKEAEEVMNRSTTLLEKGLALVELESLLREIKSYLEELVMGNKVIKDLDIDSKL